MSEPALAFCLLLILLLFAPAVRAADTAPPLQKLSISFDLDQALLRGISRIELPPGSGADIHLGNLVVDALSINGGPAPAANRVQLPPAAGPQQVTIEYHLRYGEGGHGLIGPAGISLTGFWHPLLGTATLFELAATIPDRFEAVSEANEIVTAPEVDAKRVLFRFPQPVPAINFVAGPYVVEKVPFGDGKELYTYFFPEDQELAADYRSKTLGYLQRYEREIGPFPYQRFSVVENRLPTGYAMPTFTLLGQMVVRLPFITETSLGHEVLHQWFGNSVEVDASRGNWAEGLTTYLADQAFAADQGEGASFRKNQLIKYESYIHAGNRMALAEFVGVSGRQEVQEDDLRAIGYGKCSMLFHMLRQRVGDEKFFAALQDFYLRMRYRAAAWSDLVASFDRVTGQELGPFFEQWLTRKDVPRLAVSKLRTETRDGGQVLIFELRQTADQPYDLEVPVAIATVGGLLRERIAIDTASKEVRIPVPTLPGSLVLDPDYDLMRHLAPAELPPVWSRFEGAPKKLAVMAPEEEARFRPLLDALAGYELEVKAPGEVTDAELSEATVIFLGTDTAPARALFAAPGLPAGGFTIAVRPHPLKPGGVAVLATSAGPEETAKAAGKLRHYSKYSYLHFQGGRAVDKRIAESEAGQRSTILEPPRGVATPRTMAFEEIVDQLMENRVIYVGEIHTSYEDHLLQLRVIQSLHQRDPRLAIGMEMFTPTAQEVLDAYIAGEMDEWEFLKKSRWFERWRFDYRLYRDILDFARSNKIPIIALNLDKEIVSKVFKEGGVSALSDEERQQLPPERDLDLPGYQERLAAVYTMHSQGGHGPASGKFAGFFQAQALWDETMAARAADYLRDHPEERLVVIAGRGHVTKESGIPPRVARRLEVKQAVVVNGDGRDIEPGSSDYVLFSPEVTLPPAAMLGVSLAEKEGGVLVEGFSPHGQAKGAGLKEGDFILAINDEPVRTVEDLKIIMFYREKGETVRLRVVRPHKFLPNERLTVDVRL
jgi:aminopeptidase N